MKDNFGKDFNRALKESRKHSMSERANLTSAAFYINIPPGDVIESNARDLDIDPDTLDWDQLNDDIAQIEQNVFRQLKKIFDNARDEGHDSNDALVGTVLFDPDDIKSEAYEMVAASAEPGVGEPLRFGAMDPYDLGNYMLVREVYKGISDLGERIINIEVSFDVDDYGDIFEASCKPTSTKKRKKMSETRPIGRTPGISPPPTAGRYRKGRQPRSISELEIGMLLIQPSQFGPGENLVRITKVEPDRNIAYGIFVDPDNPRTKRLASDRELAIWGHELKDHYFAESIQEATKEVPQELIARMKQKEKDELELYDINEEMKPQTIRDVMDDNVMFLLKREFGKSIDKNISILSRYGWELEDEEEDANGGVHGGLSVNGYGDIVYAGQNIATFEAQGMGIGWADSGDSEYTYSLDLLSIWLEDVGEEL